MNIPSKKSLVTGGCGFIGSHLVDRLLSQGHSVIVLDNLASGRLDNLRHHSDNPNLEIHIEDVSDYDKIKDFFKEVNWVFHLAALADIVPSIQEPLNYHRANVDGTVSVLESARAAKVNRFIYAASSSCYGIAQDYPTPESAQIKPEYPYALSKYIAEEYVSHWAQVYKMSCLSLRLINVYGPRSRTSGAYGAVFGVFLAQKLAGKPFTVVGDGKQTRDFTFISDVVKAFIAAAESDATNEVINIGSGGTYSINKLVELLGGPVSYIPKRPGEPDCTFADITKARQLLNWEPQVPFEDGVKVMLENIESWRDAPVWDEKSISVATKEWFHYLSKSEKELACSN